MTRPDVERAEARLAWQLVLPGVGLIAVIALGPLLWTLWESLHRHDLRMPWLGRPFIGLANYTEVLSDTRLRGAVMHTAFFTVVSVVLELGLGLILATAMSRTTRGRGAFRVAVLLPWAIPTVVVGLLWRFMFESQGGVVNAALVRGGIVPEGYAWFAHVWAAWVPVLLADVWKMTPFVSLLLLAGLESIDPCLYEAARIDGAGAWRQFVDITLPLLRPALVVAVLFRVLDGLRVFDLIYVLSNGGPGTATEPVSLYTFTTLLQNLRFGFGSALAVSIFVVTFALALAYIHLAGRSLMEPRA